MSSMIGRRGMLLRIGDLVGLDITHILETDKKRAKKIISGFPYGYDNNGVVYGLLGADAIGFYLHSSLNHTEPGVRLENHGTAHLRFGSRKEYNFRRYQLSLG